MYQNLSEMHRKLAPSKCLGNFWRCEEFRAVDAILDERGVVDAVQKKTVPAKGTPACVMVHPLVALAFVRWADPKRFYTRLDRVLHGTGAQS